MPSPLLCYITDRSQLAHDEAAQRARLLEKIAEASQAGVDSIQLREKDLTTRELESLARKATAIIQELELRTENRELRTKLFINSRVDVAIAVSADGIHLPANDLNPADVRQICATQNERRLTISQSCHTPEEVQQAAKNGADLAVFAPVFEKKSVPDTKPAGLEALRAACRHNIPVLALGGVTLDNAADCLRAGAAGVAGIRLFQDNDIADIVRRLRAL
jgi:thiamine-phosphate pyrophosphorylase